MPRAGLTDKQKRFVEEYLVDLNAAAASRRAGYSEKIADRIGYENLRKPEIAAAIAAAQAARAERVGLTADEVLAEIKIIALSNPWHYEIDDQGNVKLAEGVPPSAIRAVSSIKKKTKHTPGGVEHETEIKFWDKNSALDKACRHMSLYNDKLAVAATGPGVTIIGGVDASAALGEKTEPV